MTQQEFHTLPMTDAQKDSLREMHGRSGMSWEDFLAIAWYGNIGMPNTVCVHPFQGMFVGIEPDGYTHT